jgi:hypothetical protein
VLEAIADVARNVGYEYEEGADNMPENLQYGSQAEAMREVATALADWAENLADSNLDTSVDAPEWEDEEFEDDEEREAALASWREDVQQAITETCDRIAEEAQELTNDMPEYEG